MTVLPYTLNPIFAKNSAQCAARLRHSLPDAAREKKLDEAIRGGKYVFVVTEPPRLRTARKPLHVHVFYLNHLQQTKA